MNGVKTLASITRPWFKSTCYPHKAVGKAGSGHFPRSRQAFRHFQRSPKPCSDIWNDHHPPPPHALAENKGTCNTSGAHGRSICPRIQSKNPPSIISSARLFILVWAQSFILVWKLPIKPMSNSGRLSIIFSVNVFPDTSPKDMDYTAIKWNQDQRRCRGISKRVRKCTNNCHFQIQKKSQYLQYPEQYIPFL